MQTIHEILSRGEERRHLWYVVLCYALVAGLVGLVFLLTEFRHGLGEKSIRGDAVPTATDAGDSR